MAISDHFSDGNHAASKKIRDIADESTPDTAIQNTKESVGVVNRLVLDKDTHEDDTWAMRHISIHRVQPLIEAFDENGSSFVTIAEVNAFTSGRPAGWRFVISPCVVACTRLIDCHSLPRWIAYWTCGMNLVLIMSMACR